MEESSSYSRPANFDGSDSPATSWSQRSRSIRKSSAEATDFMGNKSNQIEEINVEKSSDTPAPSGFLTRTELVYVRTTKIPSLCPDGTSSSFHPSSGIESNNRREDESETVQLGQIEHDGAQPGPAHHTPEFQAGVRTGLNALPHQDFSKR